MNISSRLYITFIWPISITSYSVRGLNCFNPKEWLTSTKKSIKKTLHLINYVTEMQKCERNAKKTKRKKLYKKLHSFIIYHYFNCLNKKLIFISRKPKWIINSPQISTGKFMQYKISSILHYPWLDENYNVHMDVFDWSFKIVMISYVCFLAWYQCIV